MILLATDFGLEGPYVGQMKAVLARAAPGVPVIDLIADLPPFAPKAAAYLLPALAAEFTAGAVFLCVVDPGVGGARLPLALEADGRWFVGPDNGLLAIAGRHAADLRGFTIDWRPERLSASFHGRDLFAPAAARLATGAPLPMSPRDGSDIVGAGWPDDLPAVVYVDHYGNAMTGLRAAKISDDARLSAGGCTLGRARTFSDVAPGEAFWYENANGLVEIAVNQGRADEALGLAVGAIVAIDDG